MTRSYNKIRYSHKIQKNQHLAMLDADDTDSLCENTDLHGFF